MLIDTDLQTHSCPIIIIAYILHQNLNYFVEAVVADIRADGILGLDFLKDNDCVIDVVAKKLIVSGKDYPVQFEGKLGCYRIVASETISIPPESEMVISCVVCVPKGQTMKHFEGIVEPLENKLEQNGPLVARTLIQKQHNADPEISLRPDLQNLLEKSSKHLNSDQERQLRELILRYKESFAETDKDLGRTTLVKHKINTGDAPAFKEPPRRTPVHLQCELDKNIDEMLEKDVVEPSNSPWASGVVLVKKKDGTYRFCVDYRRLNKRYLERVCLLDVCGQWDILEVIEGILYRRFETSDNSKNRLQAIVPYSERRNVLFQCHDNKTSAHLGVRKTIERIRQKYYWPGLQADVRRYIKGCEFCNRRKNPCRTNKAPMQLVQSCHPMERIAADILGELPETENGNGIFW
ncbi:unnamed protein product [Mytilus edulis]|uniref:Integrase zinc-binding domain-containing protein n=1 Tax=Mytilus edulis TaxID=6550 RepID=A0A8S3TBY8_MYTED|nr:unnamed protein product [Mytilus edulis]